MALSCVRIKICGLDPIGTDRYRSPMCLYNRLKKERKPNFSKLEEEEIVVEYGKRKDILDVPLSMTVTAKRKKEQWREINACLNRCPHIDLVY